MKNQYFGDQNDYAKYGLIRAMAPEFDDCLVAWLLTPDEGGADGSKIAYLQKPDWRRHDPELYEALQDLLKRGRAVSLLEQAGLLPGATYFSDPVPQRVDDRSTWFARLVSAANGRALVFLDPDNGLEVKSIPMGRKQSPRYLYWTELRSLWDLDCSLLVYQHYPRKERKAYTRALLDRMNQELPGASVAAFSTGAVVFLLALQLRHEGRLEAIVSRIEAKWSDRITYFVDEGPPKRAGQLRAASVWRQLWRRVSRAFQRTG